MGRPSSWPEGSAVEDIRCPVKSGQTPIRPGGPAVGEQKKQQEEQHGGQQEKDQEEDQEEQEEEEI